MAVSLPEGMDTPTSSSSKPPKSFTRKPCAVCKEPGDGLHFGAEACRACAAFFRRSIALDKNYICRVGGTCEISSTVRNFCRACRLNKCLSSGMRKTSVQKYRENMGKGNEWGEEDCPTPNLEVEMEGLGRLRKNYQKMDDIRRQIHGRCSESIFNKADARSMNYREASDINVKEVGLLADFVACSFPQLGALDVEQQKLLYKRFFIHFLLLESGYHCAVINRSDVILMSTGDYIDMNRPEFFYSDEDHSPLMTGKDAVQTLSPSFDLFRRNLLEPMKVLQVDEIEFLALCAFSLWDHGIEGQSEDCETLTSKVRQDITKELIVYYKFERRLKEPAERLSGIMMLLPSLQRAVQRFQQDVEISHFFNYDFDDQFYKIINGRY